MKSKALVALLGLTAAGCANPPWEAAAHRIPRQAERATELAAYPPRRLVEPVSYQPIRPIRTSINGGLASEDPEAVRAGLAEGGAGPRPRLVAETSRSRPQPADPAVTTAAANPPPAALMMSPPDSQESPKMSPPNVAASTSEPSTNPPADSWSGDPVAQSTEKAAKPVEDAPEAEIPPLPDLGTLPSGDASSQPKDPSAEPIPAPSTPPPLTDPHSGTPAEAKPAELPVEPALPALPDTSSPLPQLPPDPETPTAESPKTPAVDAPKLPDAESPKTPSAEAPKPASTEPSKDQASAPKADPIRDPSLRRVAATGEATLAVVSGTEEDGPPKVDGDSRPLRESKIDLPVRAPLSQTAATVGESVITEQELVNSFRLWKSSLPAAEQESMTQKDERATLDAILNQMIEQTMLYETARHKVNNEKTWGMINSQVDQEWRDRELPKHLSKWNADNEYALIKKLADAGIDYDEVKEYYRREVLGYQFLMQSVQMKLKVDPPEIKRYYEKNLKKYDRPARVTWREVYVDVRRHPNRADALRKAQKALLRLRKGEEFAKVAREMSEGPNAAKGGIWVDTTPGSYAVGIVNDALEQAPISRITPILEDDRSYHIVRVETRRPAGPAAFPEVENEIRELLRKQKQHVVMELAMEKMKDRIVIDKPYFKERLADEAKRDQSTKKAATEPTAAPVEPPK